MFSDFRLVSAVLAVGLGLLAHPSCLSSQEPAPIQSLSTRDLPEAPRPQIEIALAEPVGQQSAGQQIAGGQGQQAQPPVPGAAPAQAPETKSPAGDSASNPTSTPTAPPSAQESKEQKAQEQIKQQEHQRVLGIIPSFNTSYVNDAVSLNAKQKISLAFRSTIDPYTFAIAFIVAGLGEAEGGNNGFGWGPEGYFKRSGATYLDAVDGTMIGNAFLPILLHQDPRYFRLGHGKVSHRLFYAIATSFICKHDNTGKWEPNYSNVGGNIISGALSNYYYPSESKSGIAQTFEAGLTVTFEGTFGAALQEFWPDISRKLFHKDPTNGLDAKAHAADEAKKQAKLNQQ
jgi:hypothetical protein